MAEGRILARKHLSADLTAAALNKISRQPMSGLRTENLRNSGKFRQDFHGRFQGGRSIRQLLSTWRRVGRYRAR